MKCCCAFRARSSAVLLALLLATPLHAADSATIPGIVPVIIEAPADTAPAVKPAAAFPPAAPMLPAPISGPKTLPAPVAEPKTNLQVPAADTGSMPTTTSVLPNREVAHDVAAEAPKEAVPPTSSTAPAFEDVAVYRTKWENAPKIIKDNVTETMMGCSHGQVLPASIPIYKFAAPHADKVRGWVIDYSPYKNLLPPAGCPDAFAPCTLQGCMLNKYVWRGGGLVLQGREPTQTPLESLTDADRLAVLRRLFAGEPKE